jgi:hypothetical protein
LIARDGKLFTFGDARRYATPTGLRPGTRVAGVAPAGRNGGYWVVTSTGQVFASGGAGTYGSATVSTRTPVVGIAATPDGHGYWLVTSAGQVFAFGDAKIYSASSGSHASSEVTGIVATPDGRGYWLVLHNGTVMAYGDAS